MAVGDLPYLSKNQFLGLLIEAVTSYGLLTARRLLQKVVATTLKWLSMVRCYVVAL